MNEEVVEKVENINPNEELVKKESKREKRINQKDVDLESKKIHRRKVIKKLIMLIIVIILLLLSVLYAILYIINTGGNFTISLDSEFRNDSGLILSKTEDFKETAVILKADHLAYMDNITESWLPNNLHELDGANNGKNYIAYSFYVKNHGDSEVDYRTTIDIKSVIKKVDKAVRIKVYFNSSKVVYAAPAKSGEPEPSTVPFTRENQVMNELREGFKPGDVDKYTVVIWLEGEDPECVDDIIGGEMKMVMTIGRDS